MNRLISSNRNIFQIYQDVQKLPFAASRRTWEDRHLIIVMKVEPKGKYGKAYGFGVQDGEPNDHLAYSSWRKDMELPNVGSYQWRLIQISDSDLKGLVERFYSGVAKHYCFNILE